jgi:DNA-binding winged helix-turn-helix (wHTH) protein
MKYQIDRDVFYNDSNNTLYQGEGDKSLKLSLQRHRFIKCLLDHPDELIAYETIQAEIWKEEYEDKVNPDNIPDPKAGIQYILNYLRKTELGAVLAAHIEVVPKRGCVFHSYQGPKGEKNEDCNYSSPIIHTCSYKQLIELGYTPQRIAERLVENDIALYGDLGIDKNEGPTSLWESFLSAYPETFQYALNSQNEIVGNWSLLCPTESHIEQIEKGMLLEANFDISETAFIHWPGEYIGYILNFSLNEGYTNQDNYLLLFDLLLRQMLAWARRGVFFSKFYVNCFRSEHESMFKGLGFHFLVDNRENGRIYSKLMSPFPAEEPWKNPSELRRLYEQHFGI